VGGGAKRRLRRVKRGLTRDKGGGKQKHEMGSSDILS
jgi:hypothetical protein